MNIRYLLFIIIIIIAFLDPYQAYCMEDVKSTIAHVIINYNQLTEEEIIRLLQCLQRVNELTPANREEIRQFINTFAGLAGVNLNDYLIPALQHNVPNPNPGNSGNSISIENDVSNESVWRDRMIGLGIFVAASLILGILWYNRDAILDLLFDMGRRAVGTVNWEGVVRDSAAANNAAANAAMRAALLYLENLLSGNNAA